MNKFLISKFIGKNINPGDKNTRRKCGLLSGIIGIICNLLMFVGKLLVGILSSSISVTADAFNNLSDAGSSIVTLVCFKIAGNPADKKHPFGHGRIEYVSGIIVSVVIIITGLGFIKTSIEKIFSPENIEFDLFSFSVLIISIVLKLWLGFFNRKISKLIKSSAMKATANDSFSDCLATITVIGGMFITKLTGLYLDAYAGLIVSGFIIYTGIKTFHESLGPLVGQAPSLKLVEQIKNFVNSYPEIVAIEELMVHDYGPSWSVISFKAKIIVENTNIFVINEIIEEIEENLEKKFNCHAIIRLHPVKSSNID
ncbi:MAG: cation diffusion facilitator transporter [Candidatus Improbicoccus pseudotrichonymphae]|uniref:Cation diffusion facilitator transporter n=1 Tax=Candidatus Improbicoccus pseudotrichonymphae TaxID=3033792 RepID=A0AA48HUW0_9FIRM|nr:MAG: cation diffusion facilitator transporter [Candidatus Improbicoccus pseudotrichonymphae]